MPLATLRVGQMQSGLSEVLVVEHKPGVNYSAFAGYLETRSKICSDKISMTKAEFQEILSSHRVRVRDGGNQVCSVEVVSATAARKQLGIEDLSRRVSAVEDALKEAESIQRQVDELCECREVAVLKSLGCTTTSTSDDSETEQSELQGAGAGAKSLSFASF